MACQLQPECNFLHVFFQEQTPHGSGRHGCQNHVYARDTLV